MDSITRDYLVQQQHRVDHILRELQIMVTRSEIDPYDRNLSAAQDGLLRAHENLQRLVKGEEHPDAIAARQAGAEALVKLGYAQELVTTMQNSGGMLPEDFILSVDPARPPVSGQHRLAAMAAESTVPVIKMPDLGEITERFSELNDDEIIDPLLPFSPRAEARGFHERITDEDD